LIHTKGLNNVQISFYVYVLTVEKLISFSSYKSFSTLHNVIVIERLHLHPQEAAREREKERQKQIAWEAEHKSIKAAGQKEQT
jgi:hypothetical protein